jgi:3-phenylpropionate/cinnamic acid dioxygenase small subunit
MKIQRMLGCAAALVAVQLGCSAASAAGLTLLLAGGAEGLSVEARLQRLEDEATIRRLLDEYMDLLDARDWDNYIELFATDAELDIVEGVLKGRDAIKTRMANASQRMAAAAAAQNRPQRQRADLLSNVKVEVDGDTATARSRFTFLAEGEDGQFRVTGSGLYTDSWIREGGEWKIKRRAVNWDLLAGQSAPPTGGAAPATRD